MNDAISPTIPDLKRDGLWRAHALLPEPLGRFLQAQSARLVDQIAVPRPWHYAELHNPWGRAASDYDSWGFLDLCQSSSLIKTVASLMGSDIILFDSQWLPNRWDALDTGSACESDAHRFPVDPPLGLTALICFADLDPGAVRVTHQPTRVRTEVGPTDVSLDLRCGDVLFVDCALPYCIRPGTGNRHPAVYAIRYFPASSRYNRDPAAPAHRILTDRYPLVNYARMPLWLVHGEDQAGNDFVTGFNVRAGFWTNAGW